MNVHKSYFAIVKLNPIHALCSVAELDNCFRQNRDGAIFLPTSKHWFKE